VPPVETRLRVTLIRACVVCLLLLAMSACGPAEPPAEPPAEQPVAEPAPAGPLPRGVRPHAYRLDLLVDPRREGLSGSVEIDIQLDEATTGIWLHGEGLDVTAARAELSDGKRVAARYAESSVPGVARVDFSEQVPPGSFTLRLDYGAEFNRNLAGLFKVEEQGEAYVLAKSESIQARKFLPGFDEPGLKATFDLKLTIPAGYAVIANSPEIDRQPAGDGMETVTFAATRPMPTYLLSLAVGPFDTVERPPIPPNGLRERPIPLRGFARKGRGEDLDYVLDITPGMLEAFERELRRPYPFEKLDIVAAPQWPSGATELSAAITYDEQRILVAGDEPAPGARLRLLGVHAHELSHMWFGNLVTPPWWDDLWLKEGFATWSEPVVLALLEPDGGHEVNAATEWIGAMQLDSLASTRAIREPITSNSDIRNAYDSITYSKSLGVIHMVDHFFGADRFRPALGRYVETFADGVADSPAFYRVIGEETDTPELTETFHTFVEMRGVPQLDLTLHCETGLPPELTIRQSRYRPLGSPIADTGQRWAIPTCLRGDSLPEQCLMLTEAEQALDLPGPGCPRWILPNSQGSGYYRWNLPESQWQALVADFAGFGPVEALSIVDSAFAAFEGGRLPETILVEVIRQSARAGERQVVTAPLGYLRKYSRQYLPGARHAAFLQFARELYQPVLDRIADSADADARLLHSDLTDFMALTAGDPATRSELTQRAYAFTGYGEERDPKALDSDLYTAALTVAVQDSGAEFLTHLSKVRQELDDSNFASASANAIGRIDNAELLDQVHGLALDGSLDPREVFGMMGHAMAEPALQEQHWQWLRDNFPAFVDRIPEQWRRFTPALGSGFCSVDRLAELQRLFALHGDLAPGHERRLAQAEEQIGLCLALRDRGQALIEAWSAR